MTIYEKLLHLATEPYEKSLDLSDNEAVLNQLTKELMIVDTRQASETMVYEH